MRLWSVHPKLLDEEGICALWKDGLFAQKVLGEKTGSCFPQLIRFREAAVGTLRAYMNVVLLEGWSRGINFNGELLRGTISPDFWKQPLVTVSRGQLEFELDHLRKKLYKRSRRVWARLPKVFSASEAPTLLNPVFLFVPGMVPEEWEQDSEARKMRRKYAPV